MLQFLRPPAPPVRPSARRSPTRRSAPTAASPGSPCCVAIDAHPEHAPPDSFVVSSCFLVPGDCFPGQFDEHPHRLLRAVGVTARGWRRSPQRGRRPDSSSAGVGAGLAAASSATRTIAPTWASSELCAASTTAAWKSRSARRRASGSAAAASMRRCWASISASCSSVRPACRCQAGRRGGDRRRGPRTARAGPRPAPCRRTATRRRRRRAGAMPAAVGPGFLSSGVPRRAPWPAAP